MIYLQLLINGLLLGGIYGLMSIGLNLVWGVVGIVNFAHGEFLMIAMYATFWLVTLMHIDPYLGLLLIAPSFFLLGYILEKTSSSRSLTRPMCPKSLSLGMGIILENLALIFWKADTRALYLSYTSASLQWGPLIIGITRLLAWVISAGITGLLFLFLKRTYQGKAVQAVAQKFNGRQGRGDQHQLYVCPGFCPGNGMCGDCGATLMVIYPTYPTIGSNFVLIAFVVVVLGGLGNLSGTIIGGLIIGIIEGFAGFIFPVRLPCPFIFQFL